MNSPDTRAVLARLREELGEIPNVTPPPLPASFYAGWGTTEKLAEADDAEARDIRRLFPSLAVEVGR